MIRHKSPFLAGYGLKGSRCLPADWYSKNIMLASVAIWGTRGHSSFGSIGRPPQDADDREIGQAPAWLRLEFAMDPLPETVLELAMEMQLWIVLEPVTDSPLEIALEDVMEMQ